MFMVCYTVCSWFDIRYDHGWLDSMFMAGKAVCSWLARLLVHELSDKTTKHNWFRFYTIVYHS